MPSITRGPGAGGPPLIQPTPSVEPRAEHTSRAVLHAVQDTGPTLLTALPAALHAMRVQLGRVRVIAAHLGVETLPTEEWAALLCAIQEPAAKVMASIRAGSDGLGTHTRETLLRDLRAFQLKPGRETARALAPAARDAALALDRWAPRVALKGVLPVHPFFPASSVAALRRERLVEEVAEALLALEDFPAWASQAQLGRLGTGLPHNGPSHPPRRMEAEMLLPVSAGRAR